MSKKKIIIIVVILLLIAAAVPAGIFTYNIVMDQREIDSHITAGDAAFEAGLYEEALAYYTLVPEDNRRYDEVQEKIAEVIRAQTASQIDSYFRAGDAAFAEGDYVEALAYFDMVPEYDARFNEAQVRKEMVIATQHALASELVRDADALIGNGRFEEAKAALDEAERVLPGYEEIAPARLRLEVAILVDSAQTNYEAENFAQALRDINAAILLDSTVETRYPTLLGNIRFEEATERAMLLLAFLKEAELPIEAYLIFDEETDPNELLGTPNGYLAKVNFEDTRIPQLRATYEPLGGSIEVFLTQARAEARKAYIDGLAETTPTATEFSFVGGSILLRLDHRLTAEQVAEYEEAFRAFLVTLAAR